MIKAAITALFTAGMVATALGQTNAYVFSFAVNGAVPNGNPSGMINQQTVAGTLGTISDLNVTLSLDVARNADLYVYLTFGGQFSVLLNRVGIASTNPFGYGAPGLNLTLDDQAANNVHWYEQFSPTFDISGRLLGTWQPDGRDADPDSVNETVNPTALLNRFNDLPANGTWTLFVADLSSDGEPTILNSWGLEITTVPEPEPWFLTVSGAFLLWCFRRIRPQNSR